MLGLWIRATRPAKRSLNTSMAALAVDVAHDMRYATAERVRGPH